MGVGLVVDGGALALLLQPQHEDGFLQLAKGCDAVICCRVSPMQKAQVCYGVGSRCCGTDMGFMLHGVTGRRKEGRSKHCCMIITPYVHGWQCIHTHGLSKVSMLMFDALSNALPCYRAGRHAAQTQGRSRHAGNRRWRQRRVHDPGRAHRRGHQRARGPCSCTSCRLCFRTVPLPGAVAAAARAPELPSLPGGRAVCLLQKRGLRELLRAVLHLLRYACTMPLDRHSLNRAHFAVGTYMQLMPQAAARRGEPA